MGAIALAMSLSAAVAACDAGSADNQPTVTGPPINLVAAGTNVGQGGTYTLDQPLIFQFDRFLDPTSVTRQSFQLTDSSGNAVTYALPSYDPVTLSVTLNPPQGEPWLIAGQMYRVVLPVPTSDGGSPYGILAIDGATLSAPQTILFKASAAASPPYAGPPTMDYCNDINGPIFGACSYSCHVAANLSLSMIDAGHPPLGLDLSSAAAVRATAINQVADESNTGPVSTTQAQAPGEPFGIDMPIIAPGSPGLSWMVYKTLLAVPGPASGEKVGSDGGISAYGQNITSPISPAERTRLSNYILGQSMPYPSPAAKEPAPGYLTEGDIERLSLWIAQGASTPSACQ